MFNLVVVLLESWSSLLGRKWDQDIFHLFQTSDGFFRHAAYSGGLKNLQLSDTVMSTWNEMLWILFYRYHGVSNRNMNCFQYRGNLGRKIGPPSILSYYHGAFQLQQARGLNKKCTYIILWFFFQHKLRCFEVFIGTDSNRNDENSIYLE